jgi:hypothetical protein
MIKYVACLLLGPLLTLTAALAAPGDDCSDPYDVTINYATVPVYLQDLTTCGTGNDYSNTCLEQWDGGEDFVIRLDVQDIISLYFELDPKGTTYTGMALSDACPPGGQCITTSTNIGSGTHSMFAVMLAPGTYYLMVDTWPPPDCIPDFDLTIDLVFVDNWGESCNLPWTVLLDAGSLPHIDQHFYTCGMGDAHDNTCLGNYDNGEDFVYQLEVAEPIGVDIILDPLGTTFTGMVLDDACPPDPSDCIAISTSTAATPHGFTNQVLEAGTYYLIVDTWPAPDCIPEFHLLIDDSFNHEMGNGCKLPQYLSVPDELPFTFSHQYTYNRGDSCNNTCLEDFDEGEDFVVELTVVQPVALDISLDPKGEAGSGLAIYQNCPLIGDCVAYNTNNDGGSYGLSGISFDVGTYYVLVDCRATTGSLFDFDLSFAAGALANDFCESATPIGNVEGLAFTTDPATFDGPAQCLNSPNLWYCYTAPADGPAIVSLNGAQYDTKLAVYDGCSCEPPLTMLACNDDMHYPFSEAYFIATAGNQYLIEIGGHDSETGDGWLEVVCPAPPCGDVDDNGMVNVSDIVYFVAYVFGYGPAPRYHICGDVDCDRLVNVSDIVYLISFVFADGPAPCAECY